MGHLPRLPIFALFLFLVGSGRRYAILGPRTDIRALLRMEFHVIITSRPGPTSTNPHLRGSITFRFSISTLTGSKYQYLHSRALHFHAATSSSQYLCCLFQISAPVQRKHSL
ncbi:hypothetical protein QBC33DRAFT_355302 [Phialemonium atrogriseum]|uniref:Secreted protein n=1 Tax=Phialemonium atrogriseum TaxID=1093897 RepID=A0AAJ0C3Z6_9PEZI|nr:uncharacterized protein QBC33DRAFT_355302 [Phialemonium atrogriseum]KAK1768678.1 hypothetical protein QBC33DRAFT_355302 [Phialemonium atrogriseum]